MLKASQRPSGEKAWSWISPHLVLGDLARLTARHATSHRRCEPSLKAQLSCRPARRSGRRSSRWRSGSARARGRPRPGARRSAGRRRRRWCRRSGLPSGDQAGWSSSITRRARQVAGAAMLGRHAEDDRRGRRTACACRWAQGHSRPAPRGRRVANLVLHSPQRAGEGGCASSGKTTCDLVQALVLQVEAPQLAALLEGDGVAAERREVDVVVGEVGDLPRLAAVEVVDPDVGAAVGVLVGQVIDLAGRTTSARCWCPTSRSPGSASWCRSRRCRPAAPGRRCSVSRCGSSGRCGCRRWSGRPARRWRAPPGCRWAADRIGPPATGAAYSLLHPVVPLRSS